MARLMTASNTEFYKLRIIYSRRKFAYCTSRGVSKDSDSDNKMQGGDDSEKVQGVNDGVRDVDDKLDVVTDGV